MRAVQDPIVPIVGRWIGETPGTISLGQGLVSYGPPPAALEAARAFGDAPGDHLYGPVEGEPDLVAAIEHKLETENGIRVRPAARVVVTAGGNMAFLNAVLATGDPGDEYLLPAPYYFNHEMAVTIAGCRPVPVPTRRDFQLDLDAIERAVTPRTRAVVTVSPNNPSGAVYPEADLRALAALCARHGLFHFHDEAYEYFTYDGVTHHSPGRAPEVAVHTISLFSLSKAYGFAGWRIGYMVVPAALFEAVNKIQDTNLICPPIVSQRAAMAALRVGRRYAGPHVAGLAARRDRVKDLLSRLGGLVEVPPAAGAFYFLVRVRTRMPDVDLVERLIREFRVAVLPGSAFGLRDASSAAVRLSYGAVEGTILDEALARLVAGIRALA